MIGNVLPPAVPLRRGGGALVRFCAGSSVC